MNQGTYHFELVALVFEEIDLCQHEHWNRHKVQKDRAQLRAQMRRELGDLVENTVRELNILVNMYIRQYILVIKIFRIIAIAFRITKISKSRLKVD